MCTAKKRELGSKELWEGATSRSYFQSLQSWCDDCSRAQRIIKAPGKEIDLAHKKKQIWCLSNWLVVRTRVFDSEVNLLRFSQTCEFWSSKANWRLRFLLPSIILRTSKETKLYFNGFKRSWFVICDWWILSYYLVMWLARHQCTGVLLHNVN